MSTEPGGDYEGRIRRLLAAIRQGDRPAFETLIESVGHEMRRLSAYHLRRPPAQMPTIQTTVLVNEAVLRLMQVLNREAAKFPETREHFMALVSKMMRFTLIDYARKRRGQRVSLDEPLRGQDGEAGTDTLADSLVDWTEGDLDFLLSVHEAIKEIERGDPEFGKRRSAALELHLFGGMSYKEIADELGVRDDTARRDCRLALARLQSILAAEPPAPVSFGA